MSGRVPDEAGSEGRLLAMANRVLDAVVKDVEEGSPQAPALRQVISEWGAQVLPLSERRLLEVAYRIRDALEQKGDQLDRPHHQR